MNPQKPDPSPMPDTLKTDVLAKTPASRSVAPQDGATRGNDHDPDDDALVYVPPTLRQRITMGAMIGLSWLCIATMAVIALFTAKVMLVNAIRHVRALLG